jgi:hypothetical protein
MLVMRLNKNLVLSGIALIILACSSKSTDGSDDDSNGGVGGSHPGQGGNGANNAGGVGGSSTDNSVATGNSGNLGGSGNPGNTGGSNGSQGGNAGSGNQAGENGVGGSCSVKSVRAVLTPPAIEFQVDITNSMTQTTNTTNGMTKWQATQAALANVLPKLPQDWLVGITFFNKPAPKDGGCYQGTQRVDIGPLAGNLQQLLDAINGINLSPNVESWTPTLNAWMFAFDYITGLWPARTQYANSHKYIVLMTDGVPTVNHDGCTTGTACQVACIAQSEYDYFISYISSLGMPNGVETFFIGVPGSESAQGAPYDPRTMLSQMAIAGGSAPAGCVPDASTGKYCHIDLTQAADMSGALSSAIQYTVGDQIKPTCDFDIPKASDSSTYVNLSYTTVDFVPAESASPQRLQRATGADCTDGQYYYNDPNKPTQLKLCPTMCDALGATTTGSVQINFECTKIG